jgi:AraC-like DNA-binding protein
MPITFLKNIKFNDNTHMDWLHHHEVLHGKYPNKDLIDAYVFSCEAIHAHQPIFNDGIPSLILLPRQSDQVLLKKGNSTMQLNAAWICCGVIKDTYWEIPQELEYILVLRFNPASFYSIFNIDPAVLQTQPVCSLNAIVDARWKPVIAAMYQQETVAEKIAFLSDALLACKHIYRLPYLLQMAIDRVDEKSGNTTVADLLQLLGDKANHKWLYRSFVKYIGIPPKKYISLQRFIHTYGLYGTGRSADLFTAAMNCGYYDYNHFIKDFKQYLGTAPSQYTWH